MTGSVDQKFYNEVEKGSFKFLDCLNDRPLIKRKYKKKLMQQLVLQKISPKDSPYYSQTKP
jgi:hypothetical protein